MKTTTTEEKRDEEKSALAAMLAPRSVAVIGATESPGSVGRALMENLRSFSGTVYPVNPKRATVLGVKAFPHDRGSAGGDRSRCHRHPGENGAADRARLRERRRERRHHHFRRLQGNRRARARAGAGDRGGARRDAHHRAELRRRDAAAPGIERDLRHADGAARATSDSSAKAARSAPRFWTGA